VSTPPVERTLDPDRDPWERQSWETARSFRAFTLYRDAGLERTVNGAYQAATGRSGADSPGYFRAWRHANVWDERVAHWDREEDRARRLAIRRQVLAMQKRHADAGADLQTRAAAALTALLPTREALEGPDAEQELRKLLGRLSGHELLRAFDLGGRAERLALGEPTEIGETAVRATVRGMTEDEARAFSGLED
jgi:hypothetical protein